MLLLLLLLLPLGSGLSMSSPTRGVCEAEEPRRGFLRCDSREASTAGSRRISWMGVGDVLASLTSWKSSKLDDRRKTA